MTDTQKSGASPTSPPPPLRPSPRGTARSVSRRPGETFLTGTEGGAVVELTLLLPIILFIFGGLTDLSILIQRSLILADAAAAGVRYGSLSGNSADTTGMQNAAKTSASGVGGFNANASAYCTCLPGSGTVSCTSTCSGSTSPTHYVSVSTGVSVPLLFRTPYLPASVSLSSTAVLPVSGQ